jgi:phosphotransferase system enzyme I (PtsP)
MDVTRELLEIVERAHSLNRILEAGTRLIAERFRVDSCLAFLIDENGELSRSAPGDSAPPTMPPRAAASTRLIATKVVAEGRVGRSCSEATSLLASPMLLRGSPVGALVLQGTEQREFTNEEADLLATICAQVVGIVENARIIDALDRGEQPTFRPVLRSPIPEPEDGERLLRGIGASPGIAIGPALFHGVHRPDLDAREPATGDPAAERGRVRVAIEKTHDDLLRFQATAAREIDEEHALIFAAHLLLLSDPMILEKIDQQLANGASAGRAVDNVLRELETQLRGVSDPYIRERIDDIDDLRSRLLSHLLDGGSRAGFGARIVIVSRIPPSLVLELKADGAQALISEFGGATSHGVLLARAMGIPTVTGIADMLASVRPGEQLIVDGAAGVVVAGPRPDTVTHYEAELRDAKRVQTEQAKLRSRSARTADRVHVVLHANIGIASDLDVARDNGAEGVGLYRTEFPFMVHDAFPTLAEQTRMYRRAYDFFPRGPIHFRLLDLGGDKFLTDGPIAAERNAFHGYRSIRVLFDHPDVLRDQVQALALAAADRPLSILIPMVTSIEELRRVKALIEEALGDLGEPPSARTPQIGAMIEVPAAVEIAAEIAREVDFLSIGTNDLMQYALVVDREDSKMAPLSNPYHPAVLRMIARVATAAAAAGKRVSVCGEIASRPDIALALLALGVDALSVVPTAIPELKQALAGARLAPMRQAITSILGLPDADLVAASLRQARSA